MALTKEQAKKNLQQLLIKFNEEYDNDRIKEYNEEATKTAFIQPFLKDVLGWNVTDRNEVSPEEKISSGRVDYGLKIDGKTKIFIEAKPARANLEKHIEQAVRYGYNRKSVPFVLLTDFEGVKLFDVTVKPDIRNPRKGIKLNLKFYEYEKKFDQLWVLSKTSVIAGELDKLLREKPKDRISVDKAILADLEKWRELLAKDIYKNNAHLFDSVNLEADADYLKEITQRILDRIIFMRFCEDRGLINPQYALKTIFEDRTDSVGLNTMILLKDAFAYYNTVFNSDLFKYYQDWEKGLQIEFRIMNEIIKQTYNPYLFDVIPLEVLGNIYEQYLGYTIRLTPQMVKYEQKPEVRKAGGVYYTPEYIVDYIVKNTVGKLLKEQSPMSLRGAKRQSNLTTNKLRILDPACGSGSFLIRAYEEMLNYYREQKRKSKPQINTVENRNVGQGFSLANQESNPKGSPYKNKTQSELDLKHEDSGVRLTIFEKAEILKNHIFGVDIDYQAVEVTKLSLMLKMLEGEISIIKGNAILPMLNDNIKCGNSLISGSAQELKKYFGEDYLKVKPFNWEEEFKDVFADGGFDVVIGNPPYLLLQSVQELRNFFDFSIKFYKVAQYKIDTYHLFLEKGISLLRNRGKLGFIVPNTFLKNKFTVQLRKFILDNCCIDKILVIPEKVFPDASVDTAIIIINKDNIEKNRTKNSINVLQLESSLVEIKLKLNYKYVQQNTFNKDDNYAFNLLMDKISSTWIDKIRRISNPLGNFATAYFGIQTFDRKKYVSNKRVNSDYKPTIDGGNVFRYRLEPTDEFVHFVPQAIKSGGDAKVYTQPKIVVRQIGKSPIATFDDKSFHSLNTIYNIILTNQIVDLKYVLAIINSFLISAYWNVMFADYKATFPKIKKAPLLNIPIRKIDVTKPNEKKLHDDLVALVEVMLDLNKKIQSAKGSAKELIQKEITKTDNKIDDLVYKLYGITEEEKKIIEGSYRR
jgi:type I restriction-modification system DNA methylase subunit